jgi:hypothetical protein
MKYIFKQIDDISGANAVTTIEFSADSLPDILEHFEMFIRGSGFHPSGTLDFVNYDDCELEFSDEELDTPQEETHEWTQTLRDDAEWPFPLKRPVESIYDGDLNSPSAGATQPWQGVAPSVAMQWTVNELMKGPMTVQSNSEKCSICGISFDVMANQKCWDVKCPIGNDAN